MTAGEAQSALAQGVAAVQDMGEDVSEKVGEGMQEVGKGIQEVSDRIGGVKGGSSTLIRRD